MEICDLQCSGSSSSAVDYELCYWELLARIARPDQGQNSRRDAQILEGMHFQLTSFYGVHITINII